MATMTTSARPERGWQRPEAERLLTGATVVTFVRTVVSVGLGLYAAYDRSLTLLLVALAVYWVGDMADGALARLTDTETRIGAVFDIVSDRLCAGTFYVGLVWLEPAMALPVGVFLLEFAVVDTFVSLAFPGLATAQPQLLLPGRPADLAGQLVQAGQGRQLLGGGAADGGHPLRTPVHRGGTVPARGQDLVAGPAQPARPAASAGGRGTERPE